MPAQPPTGRSYKIYQRGSMFEVVGPDNESYTLNRRATAYRIAYGRTEMVRTEDGGLEPQMSREEAEQIAARDHRMTAGFAEPEPGDRRAHHRATVARMKEQK